MYRYDAARHGVSPGHHRPPFGRRWYSALDRWSSFHPGLRTAASTSRTTSVSCSPSTQRPAAGPGASSRVAASRRPLLSRTRRSSRHTSTKEPARSSRSVPTAKRSRTRRASARCAGGADRCERDLTPPRDGKLYVGDCNGKVWALDAASGDTLWTFQTKGKVKAALTLSGGHLYAASYDHHLYALDVRNGKPIWRAKVQSRLGKLGTFYSTPAAAYGRVYIGSTDRKVYSYGASSGKLRWSHKTGGFVYGSPTVWRKRVYVGSYRQALLCVRCRDRRARVEVQGQPSRSPAATCHLGGRVYFSTLRGSGPMALDTRTGEELCVSTMANTAPSSPTPIASTWSASRGSTRCSPATAKRRRSPAGGLPSGRKASSASTRSGRRCRPPEALSATANRASEPPRASERPWTATSSPALRDRAWSTPASLGAAKIQIPVPPPPCARNAATAARPRGSRSFSKRRSMPGSSLELAELRARARRSPSSNSGGRSESGVPVDEKTIASLGTAATASRSRSARIVSSRSSRSAAPATTTAAMSATPSGAVLRPPSEPSQRQPAATSRKKIGSARREIAAEEARRGRHDGEEHESGTDEPQRERERDPRPADAQARPTPTTASAPTRRTPPPAAGRQRVQSLLDDSSGPPLSARAGSGARVVARAEHGEGVGVRRGDRDGGENPDARRPKLPSATTGRPEAKTAVAAASSAYSGAIGWM